MYKAQITQISFIIFSILFLLFSLFLLTNTFFRQSEKTFEIRLIDIFENLKNIINSYAKLSLYYATTQNFRSESWPWIWNGFNPIEFNWLKECKENLTTYFYNVYLNKFEVNLPVNIFIGKSEKCSFPDLSEGEVFSGKKDEGNFTVICNSTEIRISINTTVLYSYINTSNFITNNRYWYLYRKIHEWASENAEKFVSCVCSLVSGCADCRSIEKCYSGLLSSLREKFKDDKYVYCYQEPTPCCKDEKGEPCKNEPKRCYAWIDGCYVPKKLECGIVSPALQNLEQEKCDVKVEFKGCSQMIEYENELSFLANYKITSINCNLDSEGWYVYDIIAKKDSIEVGSTQKVVINDPNIEGSLGIIIGIDKAVGSYDIQVKLTKTKEGQTTLVSVGSTTFYISKDNGNIKCSDSGTYYGNGYNGGDGGGSGGDENNQKIDTTIACIWLENRIETKRSYVCEDYKYFESSPSGPNRIVFTAIVYAGFRDPKGCIEKFECKCNTQSATCEECSDSKCKKCILECKECPKRPCYYPPKKICYNCEVQKINSHYKIIKCEKCEDDPNNCLI